VKNHRISLAIAIQVVGEHMVITSQSLLDKAARNSEIRVLLAAARMRLGADGTDCIESLIDDDIDWELLVRLALYHKLTPQLHESFAQVRAGTVPQEIVDNLQVHCDVNSTRCETLSRELVELHAALDQANIRMSPFKGPTLAELAYGRSTLRLTGDIDILVRVEDIDAVLAVLAARNYREDNAIKLGRDLSATEHSLYRYYQCEYQLVRKSDGMCVEPHWAIAPSTLAVPFDYTAMWARATTCTLDGKTLPGFALEDLLIVLCVHASKHEWNELRWIADVAELVQRQPHLDWNTVLDRASAQHCLRMVLLGVMLARDLIGAKLPASVDSFLAADKALDQLAEHVASRLSDPDYAAPSVFRVSRFRLRMREHAADAFSHAWKTIVTPKIEHIRLIALPPSLHFLYYPLKLVADYIGLPLRRKLESIRRTRQKATAEDS
jgi:hypothetical protein